MDDESRAAGFPSIGELRQRLTARGDRIGTGWPVVDEVTSGLPAVGTTVVRGPADLRLQVLSRMAAWAAGEGYPTVIGSRARTTDELRLAVAAGGLGLPPRALLESTAHDAWLDDRLRVLDLRVFGDALAHEQAGRSVHARPPAVLVVDDYLSSETEWDIALDTFESRLDLLLWPRRMGLALVVGVDSMERFSEWLDRATLTVRLDPSDDRTRVTVRAYQGLLRQHRTVLLRDGYLEPPMVGRPLLRRPGVANIWCEDREDDLSAFADTLGASTTELPWQLEEDGGDPHAHG